MTTSQHDIEQARLSTADIARPVSDEAPVEPQTVDQPMPRQDSEPLFASQQASDFQQRWTDIQASFVDEPRQAVEQADMLVAEVMQRLAQAFADERKTLEQQWDRGDDTNTEELRQALRRYRSFFGRLLAL